MVPPPCYYGFDCKGIVAIVTPSIIAPHLKAGKRMEALWISGGNRVIGASVERGFRLNLGYWELRRPERLACPRELKRDGIRM
jgi:hypothetical protein